MKSPFYLCCLILAFIIPNLVQSQSTSNPLLELQVDVVYLSSNLLEGRVTGKKGESMAADYIAYRFEELGLTPKGDAGSWYHEFTAYYKSNPHAAESEARQAKNVVGYIDNGAENTVIIGAHL